VIKKISEQQVRRVSTAEINKVISTAMIKAPPRFPKNKICKLYYMTQVDVNPPTFACFINDEDKQNYTFTRWIDNVLRRSFGFIGVPISLIFKEKNAEADSSADRERDRDREARE
jgi:GTPase